MKLIYQFLYLIYCFLFFRRYEKDFEEERNKNKDGNSRGVTYNKLLTVEREWDDEILGFDVVFAG